MSFNSLILNKLSVGLWAVSITGLMTACGEPESKKTGVELLVSQTSERLLSEYESEKDETKELVDAGTFSVGTVSYIEVEPIIRQNCLFCHIPEGTAPFNLIGYKNVKKRARVIREVISQKIMPPWMADYHYSELFNAPAITDSQRAVIIEWIDQGCLEGETTGSNNEELLVNLGSVRTELPDQILVNDNPHTITSNGDSYQCFMYDPELTKSRNLIGVEFSSDNPEVIHHLMLYLDTADVISNLDSCWDCKNDGIINKCLPIQSWSKGMRPFVLNSSIGYKMNPGDRLLLQTHYGDEGHKGRKESTTLKLYYSDSIVDEVQYDVLNKFDIHYPPNEILVEYLVHEVKDPISLLGVVPHSHFLAKKMECFAVTPFNEKIPLLLIPRWDYLWQGQYTFKKPVIIPEGSTIFFFEVVDNTPDNPTQPNDPVRDVYYNTNSNDEMLTVVLLKKPYRPGDDTLTVARFLN